MRILNQTVAMIKILCLHIAENQASYRYRVAQFLPYWKEYGIEMHPVSITGKNYIDKLKLALGSRAYDYVWLQRKPLSPLFTTIISHKSQLIYDYDDALYAVESYLTKKPKPVQPGSKQMIRRINSVLRQASLVFAGSEALATYARQFNTSNTYVIPTSYERILDPTSNRTVEPITIGWIGNTGNMFFLDMIDEAMAAIQKQFINVRFSVMSGKAPEGLKTRWELVKWSKQAEDSWLRSIDIGLMPLKDDKWSQGKCAFKLLQYMAYGKPVVASAVGANHQAVIEGLSGFLATTTEQWKKSIEKLVSDPALRMTMGRKGLEHFLENYERQHVQKKISDIMHAHHSKHGVGRKN